MFVIDNSESLQFLIVMWLHTAGITLWMLFSNRIKLLLLKSTCFRYSSYYEELSLIDSI